MCVLCVHRRSGVCWAAFCSVVVLGRAGGTRLGVHSDTPQPNTENVLPALSNIFSNTLHSFLTCTTTSAQTALSLSLLHSATRSQTLYCSFRFFYLCIKSFTMHLVAACASSGVKGHRGLQFQGVNEKMMISTYHVVSRFTASSRLQCDSAENANQTGKEYSFYTLTCSFLLQLTQFGRRWKVGEQSLMLRTVLCNVWDPH